MDNYKDQVAAIREKIISDIIAMAEEKSFVHTLCADIGPYLRFNGVLSPDFIGVTKEGKVYNADQHDYELDVFSTEELIEILDLCSDEKSSPQQFEIGQDYEFDFIESVASNVGLNLNCEGQDIGKETVRLFDDEGECILFIFTGATGTKYLYTCIYNDFTEPKFP
ncbi:hypothetical protein [Mongoliitalea daihaiensis]|uniref:hypothetical protein n=1 Tax=Mongoliitalea daihaiensis TaxID=2782006 RepID=UPI001F3D0EE7|nr:hypothetical protein [Mongoliitalea daihaiensis]UJP64027.1 hypothetical protein IPZ59_14530 [Mongoliitalea daihaiensis]